MKSLIPLIVLASGMALFNQAGAADVVFTKGLSLRVIHDVGEEKMKEGHLDNSVGKFAADSGAVIYIKGNSLYLIRDTRNPVVETLDQNVSEFKMEDGLIAYIKGLQLYVRKLQDEQQTASRKVVYADGCQGFDVADGKIVFTKDLRSLHYVKDLDSGTSEPLVTAVGEFRISR